MRLTHTLLLLAVPAAFALARAGAADAGGNPGNGAPALGALSARLPPEVGRAAEAWLHRDPAELKPLLALSPASLEEEVMVALAGEPAAASFVLGRLPAETPETDRLVLRVMAVDPFWVDEPGVREALEKLAGSTADNDLMLASMEAERRIEVKALRRILTSRIEAARGSADARSLGALADADERWAMVERGASIPGFMRRPPAPFVVAPAGAPLRVVGIGDFGTGSSAQRDVAAAIVRMGAARKFDFGLTVGDNFYPSGMTGTDDPRWRDWWEALYGPLGITFYPTLGNHEWYSDDGAAAEIAYRSPSWRFPSPYYTFTAGPVQFFGIDTTEVSEAQVLWLEKAIGASTARWKVVYGHHPIFAPERDASAGSYMKYTQARLWPVLRGRVDAYLCGHQHAMARMDARDGVHFFMSGGGGAPLGKVAARAPGAAFAQSAFGFLTLEADASRMVVTLFDAGGSPFDSETIVK
jgi:hypothetical protein